MPEMPISLKAGLCKEIERAQRQKDTLYFPAIDHIPLLSFAPTLVVNARLCRRFHEKVSSATELLHRQRSPCMRTEEAIVLSIT